MPLDDNSDFMKYIGDFLKDRPGSLLTYWGDYATNGAKYTISSEIMKKCPCCNNTSYHCGDFEIGKQFWITTNKEEGI